MHAIYLTTAMVSTVFSILAWWTGNDYKLDGHSTWSFVATVVSGMAGALALVYYALFLTEVAIWIAPTLFVESTTGLIHF